ncbi:hypothetical protein AAHA92_29013 [Salvia divinorum]|uniref:Secreted protein n=1 Tax=Salvia divinorum TaxID=28513 RepID=A0ABD1FWX1_SALDI
MLLFGVHRTPAVVSSATSSSSSRGFGPPTGASRWPEQHLRPSLTEGLELYPLPPSSCRISGRKTRELELS